MDKINGFEVELRIHSYISVNFGPDCHFLRWGDAPAPYVARPRDAESDGGSDATKQP